jgi:hypothetical protein
MNNLEARKNPHCTRADISQLVAGAPYCCMSYFHVSKKYEIIHGHMLGCMLFFLYNGHFYYSKSLSNTPGLCITRMHTTVQELEKTKKAKYIS